MKVWNRRTKTKGKTTQKEGKTDEISQNKQQHSCSVVRRVNNNFLRNDAKPQITARIIKPAAPQLVKAHALQWRLKKQHKKETSIYPSIHPAIHHNQRYGEANFHKAAKLIEADRICFTSLHSFKMAISLPISRAFTVPHSPGSGWELARLSWMKHSNSPVLPRKPLISL